VLQGTQGLDLAFVVVFLWHIHAFR
jgi:hypothetical protein